MHLIFVYVCITLFVWVRVCEQDGQCGAAGCGGFCTGGPPPGPDAEVPSSVHPQEPGRYISRDLEIKPNKCSKKNNEVKINYQCLVCGLNSVAFKIKMADFWCLSRYALNFLAGLFAIDCSSTFPAVDSNRAAASFGDTMPFPLIS